MRLTALAAVLVLIAGSADAQVPQFAQPGLSRPAPALAPRLPQTGAYQPSQAGTSQPPQAAASQMPSAGGAQPVQAPRARRTYQARFDAANITHDGHLTLEQARAGRMIAVARDFAAIDTTQKGYVTMDDIKAHRRAVRLVRKAAKQG